MCFSQSFDTCSITKDYVINRKFNVFLKFDIELSHSLRQNFYTILRTYPTSKHQIPSMHIHMYIYLV